MMMMMISALYQFQKVDKTNPSGGATCSKKTHTTDNQCSIDRTDEAMLAISILKERCGSASRLGLLRLRF
ncbi:hypothetical protein T4D_3375 [Trichinella pseudospiralis]|uniref:Uncharacterized protein n=1 Tax=Trichinella pseudospiralis TaxID=6337 RepID=A0A0V1FZL5_TRIPS|nr:hypothetical protein T4D_3375 [Trichinella pseudospiralis]